MKYKSFALSFAATALMLSPFALHAVPDQEPIIEVAPQRGDEVQIDGALVSAKVLGRNKKGITIAVTARNTTDRVIALDLQATAMARVESSPMARMVQMPREVATRELAVVVEPGKQIRTTVVIPRENWNDDGQTKRPNLFAQVRPASAPASAQGQRFAQAPPPLVE